MKPITIFTVVCVLLISYVEMAPVLEDSALDAANPALDPVHPPFSEVRSTVSAALKLFRGKRAVMGSNRCPEDTVWHLPWGCITCEEFMKYLDVDECPVSVRR